MIRPKFTEDIRGRLGLAKYTIHHGCGGPLWLCPMRDPGPDGRGRRFLWRLHDRLDCWGIPSASRPSSPTTACSICAVCSVVRRSYGSRCGSSTARLGTMRNHTRNGRPSYFVKEFHTPTLVSTASRIFVCPSRRDCSSSPRLQLQKVPSKLLEFPDEGHWVLKPQNSVLWYNSFWIGSESGPRRPRAAVGDVVR